MTIDDWRSTISENERRTRLLFRIQQGEGERYIRDYAARQVGAAVARLSTFVASAEFAFIRQELAKRPYDRAAIKRCAHHILNRRVGGVPWPAGVLVFTAEADWGREYHGMTALGLTQFRYSWGPFLKAKPISAEAAVAFRAKHIFLGLNLSDRCSPWRSLFYEYDVRHSWEDWLQVAQQRADSLVYGIPDSIVFGFTNLIAVK